MLRLNLKPIQILRTAFLVLFFAVNQNIYAFERYEPDYDNMEEYVPVKDYLPESAAKAKRYGDLKFKGFEWGLILLGALLFNIGIWKLGGAEESPEQKKHRQWMDKIVYGKTQHYIDKVEKQENRKRTLYWCLLFIGFVCLYPCLFGIYYHFRQGIVHILGFILLLIPFCIHLLKR